MPKISKYYWYLILSGTISGTLVLGGKLLSDAGLSLYQVATLPTIIVFLFFLPFVISKKSNRYQKGSWKIIYVYGIIAAFLSLAQFGSVILGAPIAVAVLLLYTEPLWTIFFSIFLLKEQINKYRIIAAVIVILGIIILVNPFALEKITSWPGVAVALIGGILLSGWVVTGSIASKKHIQPISLIFYSRIIMLSILALSYPVLVAISKDVKIVSTPFAINPGLIIWVILFAFFSIIVCNLLYLHGVKKVPTVDAGVIMLLEPVSAAILASIVLHQAITLPIIIGGILVLFANYLIIIKGNSYSNSSQID